MRFRSLEIGSLNYHIALKFDRHLDNIVAEVPVKFQNDRTLLKSNSRVTHNGVVSLVFHWCRGRDSSVPAMEFEFDYTSVMICTNKIRILPNVQ